ncbi:helix-turn-helix domain-containing protein [Clostridium tyrobutyricum]|uniref:helix-turn-helix domain-containing protein n=1 Tax=Clostridium tyrobutyricum TaxID=1519 RepID=UPI001C392E23|nr:helix-turn-helix domain-containing protein [Clostridium tyrobutyricum]MBV4418486.1 helix-turn-helix domain-containing protein [Clostridium tyrobutyricum]MBV4450217.1 helix-turn-helix domain-containing protein [Clostridium tyrobutyricum]
MILDSDDIVISPKQPYFLLGTSYYYKSIIMNYGISHFYCFQKDAKIESPIVAIPDGCFDILFLCDEYKPHAYVCGTVLHYKSILNSKNKYFFGVRFLPGSSFKFKDVTMSELVENEVPFLEIIKDTELFEKIVSSRNFNYQIQIFMDKYLKLYNYSETANKYKDLNKIIMNNIMETAGQIRVKELAEVTGYSDRYITKVFSESFGLSPKVFCKLIRFQYLLENLNNFKREMFYKNFTDISIKSGYYDQSHMIKDFYEFTNTTPSKYMNYLQKTEYKNKLIII